MKRKSKDERDLATLAEKVAAGRTDLDERRRAEVQEESERDRKLDDLAADLGLGNIDESAYERAKVEADAQLARARYERERAEQVERPLAARAADLSELVWRAKIEAAQADINRPAAAIAEAEALLVKLRAEEALAEDRLALIQRDALDARSRFDEAEAAAAATRKAKDARKVAWHVQERHDPSDPSIPVHLREAVAAEIERRKAEDAEYRVRLRNRPDYVGRASDGEGALADGQPFPLLDR